MDISDITHEEHDACHGCINLNESDEKCVKCIGFYCSDHDVTGLKDMFISEDYFIKAMNNPYWQKICKIAEKQRMKGIQTYGQGLEDNPWSLITRLDYLSEELVDALMYIQWIKEAILGKEEEHE